MFTGIIEQVGKVVAIAKEGTNLRITLKAEFLSELSVDQSVSHNGVCLTVEKLNANNYEVVAVQETLEKTNLGAYKTGQLVNLERCMKMNDRLDGHIVQGHVDCLARVASIIKKQGSWDFKFDLYEDSKLIVEKGSICINGVSLTAFDVSDKSFKVTIIPYTFENTVFKELVKGDEVNLEFDIIGKYIKRLVQ